MFHPLRTFFCAWLILPFSAVFISEIQSNSAVFDRARSLAFSVFTRDGVDDGRKSSDFKDASR